MVARRRSAGECPPRCTARVSHRSCRSPLRALRPRTKHARRSCECVTSRRCSARSRTPEAHCSGAMETVSSNPSSGEATRSRPGVTGRQSESSREWRTMAARGIVHRRMTVTPRIGECRWSVDRSACIGGSSPTSIDQPPSRMASGPDTIEFAPPRSERHHASRQSAMAPLSNRWSGSARHTSSETPQRESAGTTRTPWHSYHSPSSNRCRIALRERPSWTACCQVSAPAC